MYRSILLMLGAGLLSSCFFVEVRGPVVGAIVAVEEWNYRFEEMETLGFSEKTLGPVQLEAELGSDTWYGWPAKTQLAFMGGTELPEDVVIRPNKLYVVRSGPTCLQDECLVKGMDYDPYGNQTLADTPITVDGQMFAFATGEQILQQSVRVSPLTTALYHYAGHFTANNFIIDELNAIAPKFVSDMDKNGLVDYADVLRWSRQRHEKQYRGDIRELDVLADKIRDRDSYFYRESWIEIVGSEGARQLMGRDYVGSVDGFDGYRLADGEIYRSDGVPFPQAQVKALWLGEAPTDRKIYSIEWWGYYKLEDLPEDTQSALFWLGLYTGQDSGVPDSKILQRKVKANLAPNPDDPYKELRLTSEYSDYDGRMVYRYNAVLREPLLVPSDARWLSIAQIDPDTDEPDPGFVLLASRGGDARLSFSTQYGWMTPSYNNPRRPELRGYIRVKGIELE